MNNDLLAIIGIVILVGGTVLDLSYLQYNHIYDLWSAFILIVLPCALGGIIIIRSTLSYEEVMPAQSRSPIT